MTTITIALTAFNILPLLALAAYLDLRDRAEDRAMWACIESRRK